MAQGGGRLACSAAEAANPRAVARESARNGRDTVESAAVRWPPHPAGGVGSISCAAAMIRIQLPVAYLMHDLGTGQKSTSPVRRQKKAADKAVVSAHGE
jgi:hypothetical protein